MAGYNGLLGIRLLPSDLALLGLGTSGQEAAMDFEAADATPTTVPEEEEHEDETSFTETFLSIEEEKRRTMTRGQKKHFEQNVHGG